VAVGAIVAAIVGGILGALVAEERGAVAGFILGWLVWRSWRQARRLDALQREVSQLRRRPGAAALDAAEVPATTAGPFADVPKAGSVDAPVESLAPTPASAGSSPMSPPSAAAAVPALAVSATAPAAATDSFWADDAEPAAAAAHVGSAVSAAARLSPAPPSRFETMVRGWIFGGNTIVKAGIAILFIGLAFLAKFASEHVHVPIEMRLASIAAVAIALLGVGWRLRLARPGYAQVLQGGAIAVLDLVLFAAFRYYGLIGAVPAFGLMVAVVALAAALAVLQDAPSLAVVGAIGGFATPILVSTGSGNHVALFTYYLVLDLGIVAIAWYRTWRLLNLVGFLGTFIVATAWGVLRYRPENFASSEAFLVAFFLLFTVVLLLPARRASGATATGGPGAWINGTLLFGVPTITFVLQAGLVRDIAYATAASALVLAAFYVALAAFMRRRPQLGVTFEATLAIATVFLTLVIPFALDARSTSGAWALEGAGLVWIGLRQGRVLARSFGYVLFLVAGCAMLFAHERHGLPTTPWNAYAFNAVIAAAAALAAAGFLQGHARRTPLSENERVVEPLLVGFAVLWFVAESAVQIDTFVAYEYRLTAWVAVTSLATLVLSLVCDRLDWRNAGAPALLQAPLLALAVLASAIGEPRPSAHGGAWAWPLALAVHLVVLRTVVPRWPRPVGHAVHVLGVLVLGGLGALEGRAVTAGWGDPASAWPWLGWLVVPAVLLFLLPRAAFATRWPMRAEPDAYRRTASALLAVGLWLWTLIANVASDGTAQPLPHLPLVNPLDIGVGLALAAIALWLREVPDVHGGRPEVPMSGLALAGFVWLNAMLVRGFHHYAGVPYRFDAWTASLAVQTGITLLWTATALVLMWLAARRGWRIGWLVGAGLLGLVVVKLLLVDLSGSGTVTRIVSFIGVGLLMLVIGYVAPLPAKEKSHVAT
jgi:uncharacterized membrane protein